VYGDLVKYILANGGVPLGSQSATKVAQRVLDIDRQWRVGEAAGGGMPGPPSYIPNPPAGPYVVPFEAQRYFIKPISALALTLFGGIAIMVYLIRNRQ
jgi:hypothetical protein